MSGVTIPASSGRREVRFTLGLVLFTLLVINAGGWIFYGKARVYMEMQSRKRLITVAKAAAAQVDVDALLALRPGDETSSGYRDIRDRLGRLRDDAELDEIFLFAPYMGNLVDTRPGVAIGAEQPFADIDDPALAPLWEGEPAALPLYESGGERFQRAFVPIVDGGELTAIVGVEASARFLSDLAVVRRGLVLTALLSIVLAGGLGAYVYRSTRQIVALHGEIKNREKLAALGTLTAGLAHEIRNPLGIIRASAELLMEEEEERGNTAPFSAAIIEEVDRLSGLLTSFLDFAKPKELSAERGDLGELVGATAAGVAGEFDRAGVKLETRPGDGKYDVPMDEAQIRQVLLNLLLNAKDAVNGSQDTGGAAAGGARAGKPAVSVTVERRRRPRGSARFPSGGRGTRGGFVEVTVKDNGCGIPSDKIDNLFDPFFTTKKKGTGLGLSIVHGIIKNHDGYLFVESDEKQGSRIGFGLPL